MRVLDLFCGAGGAAMGYHLAGFDEIVGVDIMPQPNYPFEFRLGDALQIVNPDYMREFDLIHASPPCQHWSLITRDKTKHPDLIEPTRRLLVGSGVPYIIENVEKAPLVGYLKLCGSMFGIDIQRHRYFELSFAAMSLACNHKEWIGGRPWTVTGKLDGASYKYKHSWKPSLTHAKTLMGTHWMGTMHEVAEAIPPAYTQFIGEQFLTQVAA
jgi:DNA (cytosine-5)-methyltransferase 1